MLPCKLAIHKCMSRVNERRKRVGQHRILRVHIELHAQWQGAFGTWRSHEQCAAVSVRLEPVDDSQHRIQEGRPFEVRGLARRLMHRGVDRTTQSLDATRHDVADRKELKFGKRQLILEPAGLQRGEGDTATIDVQLARVAHIDNQRVRR